MLKAALTDMDLHNMPESYEFKELEVKELNYGVVCLYAVSGLKDDEGTMAELTCRITRQIFVGKNGGLRSYNNQKKGNKGAVLTKWSDVIIYGYAK